VPDTEKNRDQRLGLWAAMQEENAEQVRPCTPDAYAGGFRAFQEKLREMT
jgi:2-(1,2-epoxy-1,2-dihydrophenyl)acetyl-CoA isomerase